MPAPLEISTSGDRDVIVRRSFDAPPALVWRCYTEPDLIRRWYGLPDWKMSVCEFDARVGGRWRFVTRSPSGFDMGTSGTVLELLSPKRLRFTELYDQDWTGGETEITTVFHDEGDTTSVTLAIRYASEAARNTALATPMATGMEIGFARLDALLAEQVRA